MRGFALTNHSIFVAGTFGYIGGEQRSCLAELDLTTGMPTAWDAHMSGSELNSIAVSGNTLYVAGYFSAIGGQNRAGLAALDTSTALATNWDAAARLPLIDIVGDRGVDTVALIGNTVYAGGGFTAIAGQQRYGIAALSASDGIFHDTFE